MFFDDENMNIGDTDLDVISSESAIDNVSRIILALSILFSLMTVFGYSLELLAF